MSDVEQTVDTNTEQPVNEINAEPSIAQAAIDKVTSTRDEGLAPRQEGAAPAPPPEPKEEPAPHLSFDIDKKGTQYHLTAEEARKWHDAYLNDSKWKEKNRIESEQLNERRTELDAHQENLAQQIEQKNEELRGVYDRFWSQNQLAESEIYHREQKLQEAQQGLANDMAKWTKEKNEIKEQRQSALERSEGAQLRAVAELTKDYPDFNIDKVAKFSIKNFNKGWVDKDYNRQPDTAEFYKEIQYHYWAELGSRMEEIQASTRAEMVRESRRKKGLPATGKKESHLKEKDIGMGSMDEITEYVKGKFK